MTTLEACLLGAAIGLLGGQVAMTARRPLFVVLVVAPLLAGVLVFCISNAHAQDMSAPENLAATAVSDSQIDTAWGPYQWRAIPLDGGEEYGFELERAICEHEDCEPPGPGPFTEIYRPTFVALLGDCDFIPYEGSIDLFDVIRAQDVTLGSIQPNAAQVALCNADCAGETDVFDVLLLADDVLGVREVVFECLPVEGPTG